MARNYFVDETAGHQVVVAAMAEARPLLRSALLGAYVELISMTQKKAMAAVDAGDGAVSSHVDDLVTYGEIVAIEPFATQDLLEGLARYNYLEPTDTAGVYRLIKHKKLIDWEPVDRLKWRRDSAKDLKDEVLRRAVRYRDGDQCRVCRIVVRWGGPDGPDKGQLDHVIARTPARGDPEALAVTCTRCNGLRSDRPDADTFAPHQPVPEHPFYTASTASYLRAGGYLTQVDGTPMQKVGLQWRLKPLKITPPQRKTNEPPRDPATSGTPRTATPPLEPLQGLQGPPRPATQADPATPPRPAHEADTAPRDPASGETPRTGQIRPKSDVNPTQIRRPDSQPDPSHPRTNQPLRPPGLSGGDGKGREGSGLGPGRRRARRGRRGGSHGG
ncbi:hypothetical protein [Demequina sp.]|uniref:hypothetical protein n=1 Tax=Demequina sp. TaxID=2050685 RepID=UPI0025BE5597|nr:hypothetical protein [Demequina sp.]